MLGEHEGEKGLAEGAGWACGAGGHPVLLMVGLGDSQPPPVLQAAVAEPCRVSATKQRPQHPPALPGVCDSAAAAAAARHRQGALRAAPPGSFRLSPSHLGSCFEGFFLSCSFVYTRAASKAGYLKQPTHREQLRAPCSKHHPALHCCREPGRIWWAKWFIHQNYFPENHATGRLWFLLKENITLHFQYFLALPLKFKQNERLYWGVLCLIQKNGTAGCKFGGGIFIPMLHKVLFCFYIKC